MIKNNIVKIKIELDKLNKLIEYEKNNKETLKFLNYLKKELENDIKIIELK